MNNIKILLKKISDFVDEINTYEYQKNNFLLELEKLFSKYQKGHLKYFEYEKLSEKLLKGKTKKDWIKYYNSYIYDLLNKIEALNTQVFYETYNDHNYSKIKFGMKVEPDSVEVIPKIKSKKLDSVLAPVPPLQKPLVKRKIHGVSMQDSDESMSQNDISAVVEVKPTLFKKLILFLKKIFVPGSAVKSSSKKKSSPIISIKEKEAGVKENKQVSSAKHQLNVEQFSIFRQLLNLLGFKRRKLDSISKKEGVKSRKKDVSKTHKQTLWDKILGIFRGKSAIEGVKLDSKKDKSADKKTSLIKKEEESFNDVLGTFFGWAFIKEKLFKSKKDEYISKIKKNVPLSTLELERVRRKTHVKVSDQVEHITATMLQKEAKRIRAILESRKSYAIYKPSIWGQLANVTIKRLSLWLLETFPDLFKTLYNNIRLANLKILSNTYVNLMVFFVIFSGILGLGFFSVFFGVSGLPFKMVAARTFAFTLIAMVVTAVGFWQYPPSIISTRRASINSNLPFAVNHMSSVASSGVPPTKMFKLIAKSKEYGEISVEIEKIVNYVEVFGYDFITALRTVSATTPSDDFREFFDGIVSTIQSGGDIKDFLTQKSNELMDKYKLEREKYTETIATFSDIYTGLLIAAPLFFVAALSLVGMLGGQVGGVDVEVVIVVGTYIVIPILNVLFIMFLSMSQPDS